MKKSILPVLMMFLPPLILSLPFKRLRGKIEYSKPKKQTGKTFNNAHSY
ncbi:hypothetical protein J4470_04155 [Candidatus Woesearchaeota archaeon]|nr:hypothetical protein [Candidatus Woesearchaeota archaeon]